MAEDSWHNYALPILERFAAAEDQGESILDVARMAGELGLDPRRVSAEVGRLLDGGYIGEVAGQATMNGLRPVQDVMSPRLRERGARAVGRWPKDPAEVLLEILDRRIERETDPEQLSRLQRLRGHVLDIGKGAIGNVLVEVGKYGVL